MTLIIVQCSQFMYACMYVCMYVVCMYNLCAHVPTAHANLSVTNIHIYVHTWLLNHVDNCEC